MEIVKWGDLWMSITKSYVTIKGTKDGLVFNMDDSCSYQDLILELTNKLERGNQTASLDTQTQVVRVSLLFGNRFLSKEQEKEIRSLIRSKGNLVVDRFESHVVSKEEVNKARLKANIQIINKTIRSGQLYNCDGNVLVLGDVNPGGCIQANGSIYVMGSLRGMAHAGFHGDENAIIAASVLQPTQLRIATIMSRPPDEWDIDLYQMEFAYIEAGQIIVDKLHHLAQIRPELKGFV